MKPSEKQKSSKDFFKRSQEGMQYETRNFSRIILIAFCLSNVSALMYQIVWGRELGYIFGTSMYAVSTVLTSFMAGLAIGSYIFGKIVDHHKDPVKLFSYIEIATGIYGIGIIYLFKLMPTLYLFLYDIFSGNQQIFIFSLFFMASVILIIPTTLIGGTFPVVSKIFNKELKSIGKDIGVIYGADTIGACIGVILGGFILLPLLGLSKTIIIAAIINILIGIFILRLPKKMTKLDKYEKEGGVTC